MIDADQARRWQDVIVEHSQFPRHHHEVCPCTHQGAGENPLCGDRVTVQFRVDDKGVIEEIGCQSIGCAISIASASLLAANLHGIHVDDARQLFARVRGLLLGVTEGTAENERLGDLESLQMVRQYPSRVKCASLVWHALNHALSGESQSASTE